MDYKHFPTIIEAQQAGSSVLLGLENGIINQEVSRELRDRTQSLVDEFAGAMEREAQAIKALRQIDHS